MERGGGREGGRERGEGGRERGNRSLSLSTPQGHAPGIPMNSPCGSKETH